MLFAINNKNYVYNLVVINDKFIDINFNLDKDKFKPDYRETKFSNSLYRPL